MPSTKKTQNLQLNKWLGSDKPKKDDFNEDNEILDQSIADLGTKLAQAQSTTQDLIEKAGQQWETSTGQKITQAAADWNTRLETAKSTLSSATQAVQTNLTGHTGNGTIHTSQSEKNAWNSAAPIVKTYTGNGSTSQKITLGYKPRAGMVFAVGQPPVVSNWNTQAGEVYAAFLSANGAGAGITVENDGFRAINSSLPVGGYSYRFNENGYTYVYIVWK